MIRYAAILLVVWALIGSPTLCVAGVLSHNCACDEADRVSPPSCCAHEMTGGAHEDKCSHESECGNDPCGSTVARNSRPSEEADFGVLLLADVLLQPLCDISCGRCVQPRCYADCRIELPFPPSDIPLLI